MFPAYKCMIPTVNVYTRSPSMARRVRMYGFACLYLLLDVPASKRMVHQLLPCTLFYHALAAAHAKYCCSDLSKLNQSTPISLALRNVQCVLALRVIFSCSHCPAVAYIGCRRIPHVYDHQICDLSQRKAVL